MLTRFHTEKLNASIEGNAYVEMLRAIEVTIDNLYDTDSADFSDLDENELLELYELGSKLKVTGEHVQRLADTQLYYKS